MGVGGPPGGVWGEKRSYMKLGVIPRAKNGSSITRVGTKKGIQPIEINKAAI